MHEAEFLAALRALPLHPGADGLSDDTASLAGLTITTDTIVETVHFLSDDSAEDIAWKLVAVNLSDLAAKGAVPQAVLLNYPCGDDEWDRAFLKGFGEALTTYDCKLLGGDTVSLPVRALRVLSLTAIGSDASAVARSGAKAGNGLWVTGTIGDAGAGLKIAGGIDGPAELLAAYRRPVPLIAEGRALAPLVHAMMDVSDGLLIDAQRMAQASGLAVSIDVAEIPLSEGYRAYVGEDRWARIEAATAGDDYQLLFAAAADFTSPIPVTRVGSFAEGRGLTLTDNGRSIDLPPKLGFLH
ncbi:MAG: thiamine-monophosphate kinase [Sphingomonas bacterium]|nr:thiamine-monophosphate kinase [Sphingomonas bacterium]